MVGRAANSDILLRRQSSWGRGRRLKWSSGHTIQLSIRIELGAFTDVPGYVQRATEIA